MRVICVRTAPAHAHAHELEARTGGKGKDKKPKVPEKECICPDSPNSQIKWGGKKKDQPKCFCPGDNQGERG